MTTPSVPSPRSFINKYARRKNRSWVEVARLLGLKPDQDDDKQLLRIKGGLVDRWGNRRIGEITKRDVISLIEGVADHIQTGRHRDRRQSDLGRD